MTTLNATPTTFAAVLKTALPGDIILLAAGAYGPFNAYKNPRGAPGVVVQATPGAAVSIAGISLNESPGWTFSGIEITPWEHNGTCVTVQASDRVHLDRCNVHGDVTKPPGSDPSTPVLFRGSKDCSISNCEVHHTATGITHFNCDGLTISRNHVHHIRIDGVRGGPSNNVTVQGNRIHDIYPIAGDHPDGIQFWTTGATGPVTGITVKDNDLRLGDGLPFQGIFIKDEGAVAVSNVLVRGNLIESGHYHGISVYQASGVVIDGNFVQGIEGCMDGAQQMRSWILVNATPGVQITNNVSSNWVLGGLPLPAGNQTIPLAKKGDYTLADQWKARRSGPNTPRNT